MSIQRFLIVAIVIFAAGLFVLYSGINRVPLRDGSHGATHQQLQQQNKAGHGQ